MEVRAAMSAKGISIDAIAGVLSVHRNTASSKVNGKIPFTVDEAFRLKGALFTEYDLEYLFSESLSNTHDQSSA